MPEPAPPGIMPLFLRGVTAEKYGFKTGEGVMDLVAHLYIKKEDVVKEIATLGVMSDFEPAKKAVDSCPCESLLFVIDKASTYGEVFLMCYTAEAQEEFMKKVLAEQEAIEAQKRAEIEAEEARVAAEYARANVVYEDKPVEAKPWRSETTGDTELEVGALTYRPFRVPLSVGITRPKKTIGGNYKFSDRDSTVGGNCEFKSVKDPNFKIVLQNDIAIQAAPLIVSAHAQTNFFKAVNKSVQYNSIGSMQTDEDDENTHLLSFLEKVTVKLESALQQNESVDIFNEAFYLAGEDEAVEGAHTDNELKEIKNFADPMYSKAMALVAIDGMPKAQGILAVSAVRNMSFDRRLASSGASFSSYILIWDFRQLVKPIILMQCQHEVHTFRFNKVTPSLVAGGCGTGQVALWDLSDALAQTQKKRGGDDDRDDRPVVSPICVSSVDHSHKKGVADLFWLPATTQINFRGSLVGQEHLDGLCHQFVTVSADGCVMVWDTRYEKIATDELRHIARQKHVPFEKVSGKDGVSFKYLWAPVHKAPLKRLEGAGELSLCRVCCSSNVKGPGGASALPGDARSHLMISTEEGDLVFADICAAKPEAKGGEEDGGEEEEAGKEYVKWCVSDHARPPTALQLSPFFPDTVLTVGDWNFHIWRVGDSKPLFSSPLSSSYLTAGAWSPSRPAVVLLASGGDIVVWDLTDSSFRPSAELKATHSKITSLEFLQSTSTRQQLLAVGDEAGTLHVYEVPRNLIRPAQKEQQLMAAFLEREAEKHAYVRETFKAGVADSRAAEDDSRLNTAEPKEPLSSEQLAKAAHDAAKKEEDDFLKLELAFISEVGLPRELLPAYIRDKVPVEAADDKKK